jgi:uncharacterized protein YjdB
VTVSYKSRIQSKGWETSWKKNGKTSGKSGKRLEGIYIKVSGNSNLGIQYTTYCQTYGWLPWAANGELGGTDGESKRMEAIKIQLTGKDKGKYDIYYRVKSQGYGWQGWTGNGNPAGTVGRSKRIEAIQIIVVKKGVSIDKNMNGVKNTLNPAFTSKTGASTKVSGAKSTNVAYNGYVQSSGWQGWRYNGKLSGTTGKKQRLEGIQLKLTNAQYTGSITYRTYIQGSGWQSWKKDGATSGKTGKKKRLETVQIKLTGTMAKKYDVYYRVYSQGYGWLAWAKNGASAGTIGKGKRIEAVQVVLVKKNGKAPAKNYKGVKSTNKKACIK